MRWLKITGIIIMVLSLIYFIGPKPSTPAFSNQLPLVPGGSFQLQTFILEKESAHTIKPGNEAKIIWFNDSLKNTTDYAIVYLHGFSASHEEGNPVHVNFARKFGCNLFLARLAEHGLDTADPMINITADKLWNSAKEAYAVGKQLGKQIILMATSTGGTLALKLAAEFPDIAGLILLSPNIAINDKSAWMLNNPWGLQIARLMKGNFNTANDTTSIYKKYWYPKYRIESVVQLEELVESTMRASLFEKVTQPSLLLYYYKDEKLQDPVVKVSGMKRMFTQLGTAPDKKRSVAIPYANDHVIGSWIKSKDIKTVEMEMEKFGKDILGLRKTNQQPLLQ